MVLKSIYFMFFVCVFLFGMMACSSKPKDKFTNLSSDEFERLIEDRNVQRLDVRTVAEYSEGHIPGSIQMKSLTNRCLWLFIARAAEEAGMQPDCW